MDSTAQHWTIGSSTGLPSKRLRPLQKPGDECWVRLNQQQEAGDPSWGRLSNSKD